jgi:hypothetical protein
MSSIRLSSRKWEPRRKRAKGGHKPQLEKEMVAQYAWYGSFLKKMGVKK